MACGRCRQDLYSDCLRNAARKSQERLAASGRKALFSYRRHDAAVAQLEEQPVSTRLVGGSSPSGREVLLHRSAGKYKSGGVSKLSALSSKF